MITGIKDFISKSKDDVIMFLSDNKIWLMLMGGMFFLGFIWGVVVA